MLNLIFFFNKKDISGCRQFWRNEVWARTVRKRKFRKILQYCWNQNRTHLNFDYFIFNKPISQTNPRLKTEQTSRRRRKEEDPILILSRLAHWAMGELGKMEEWQILRSEHFLFYIFFLSFITQLPIADCISETSITV